MAKIAVKLNGTALDLPLLTLEVVRDVITTSNPGSITIENAMATAGGMAFVEAFRQAGSPGDVVELYEDEILRGRGTRAVVAAKMEIAVQAKSWRTEIFTDKKGEKVSKDKGTVVAF